MFRPLSKSVSATSNSVKPFPQIFTHTRRWYDQNELLSLAVKCLTCASPEEQAWMIRATESMLEGHARLFDPYLQASLSVCHLYPTARRSVFISESKAFLETLKALPTMLQQEMALHILSAYYQLVFKGHAKQSERL